MKNLNLSKIIIAIATICTLFSSAKAQVCGDADGNGVFNGGDMDYLKNYILEGGPAPIDFQIADVDNLLKVTTRDILLMALRLGSGGAPLSCPPAFPFTTVVDSSIILEYTGFTNANATSTNIEFAFVEADFIQALCLPMKILAGGNPATIDSVNFGPAKMDSATVQIQSLSDPEPGVVVICGCTFYGLVGFYSDSVIATVSISHPANPIKQPITIEWVLRSPAQAPAPDSSVFPMVVTGIYADTGSNYTEPVLRINDLDDDGIPNLFDLCPTEPICDCCTTAGDADYDGGFNIADVTFLIARIFAGGAAPLCCASADANGDGSMNIADVTFSIARIFTGGTAPICGPVGLICN